MRRWCCFNGTSAEREKTPAIRGDRVTTERPHAVIGRPRGGQKGGNSLSALFSRVSAPKLLLNCLNYECNLFIFSFCLLTRPYWEVSQPLPSTWNHNFHESSSCCQWAILLGSHMRPAVFKMSLFLDTENETMLIEIIRQQLNRFSVKKMKWSARFWSDEGVLEEVFRPAVGPNSMNLF